MQSVTYTPRGRSTQRTSQSEGDVASSSASSSPSPARNPSEEALREQASQHPTRFDLQCQTPVTTAQAWLRAQSGLASLSQELGAIDTEFCAIKTALAGDPGFSCSGRTLDQQSGHAQAHQALTAALETFRQIFDIEGTSSNTANFSAFGMYFGQLEQLQTALRQLHEANHSLLGHNAPGMARLGGLMQKLDAHMQRFVQCAQPLKAEIEHAGFHIDAHRIGRKT